MFDSTVGLKKVDRVAAKFVTAEEEAVLRKREVEMLSRKQVHYMNIYLYKL